MAVAPGGGRVLAVKVGVGVNVVLLAEAYDDPVANVRGDAAIVRIVRCADPGELAVVGVLVAVELFPITIRIGG
jgi:hypothetical protein